jgi:hypothetical protein
MPVVSNATSTWDSITSVGNGWYYCKKATTSASSNQNWGFWIIGGNAHYIDNCQIEKRTYVTPYVNGTRNSQAIWVEEGTTNLLNANQSSFETSNAGWSGQLSTTSQYNLNSWNGTASLKISPNGTASNVGAYVTSPGIAVTPGASYTASVYVKKTSGGPISVYLNIDWYSSGASLVGTTTGSIVPIDSLKWARLITTGVAPSGAAYGIQYVYSSNSVTPAESWLIDGAQFEQKAYATSWVLGGTTRNAETITVPSTLLNPSAGTVILRAFVDGDAAATNPVNSHYLFSTRQAGPTYAVYLALTTTYLQGTVANSSSNTSVTSNVLPVSKGWHVFAIRWSSTELSIWMDGVKKNFTANPNIPPMLTNPNLSIGYDVFNGGGSWNNIIDDVAIFPYALDDATMATYTTL